LLLIKTEKMSESILNALIHLFALVANVNENKVSERGRAFVLAYLKRHLGDSNINDYLTLYDDYFDFYSRELKDAGGETTDSALLKFQVANICGQINRELHQNDRIIVLLRLLEFVNEDNVFTDLEREFIQAVTENFDIPANEVKDAKAFLLGGPRRKINPKNVLIIQQPKESSVDELEGAWVERHKPKMDNQEGIIERDSLDGRIVFLLFRSTGAFVFRYFGNSKLTLKDSLLYPESSMHTIRVA
jgi:ABC transport system ATP-binding/permease protein